jgi:hypothetical protein
MAKTKKLDIFNLFYSGAAVVILIGVIAKLLEWPAQDLLITGGLAIEAVVFGVSAIKFIEVKKDNKVATEETLSKMAQGIGNLTTGINVTGSGKIGSSMGVNTSNATMVPGYLLKDSLEPHYTEASWKLLEQMDVLTLAKDLFYHPNWVTLKSDEYAQLSDLFKSVFDKKLPSKDALPFLIKFPVAFPVSNFDDLHIEGTHVISLTEMEILWKSLNITEATYLFEKAAIEETPGGIIIRSKQEFEIQIFGGASTEIIAYAKKYHPKNLIISPSNYYLLDRIRLKEADLINYFIEQGSITDEEQVISLSNLLIHESDEIKEMLWNRFDKITYDSKNEDGFLVLKALVGSAAHFKNSLNGSALLLDKLEVITNSNEKITRSDVINFSDEIVYFGNENEYNVKLSELFTNGELANLNYFKQIIEKLAIESGLTSELLNQFFGLVKEDTVEDLLRTLNRNLAKTNSSATGAQLSFVLLCKVFIKS